MSAAPLRHPRSAPSGPVRSVPARGAQPRRAGAPGAVPSRTPQQPPRRHLQAVQAPDQARSLVPFAWTCALIVVAALTSVLLLNTAMASGAYERRDLKIEIAALHEQRATLVTTLEQASAPKQLAADAEGLGMQPASNMGFISLADSVLIQSGGK